MRYRLDAYLVKIKQYPSLAAARDGIENGEVSVGGFPADNPSRIVNEGVSIKIQRKNKKYVSRGGYKLEKALDVFSIDPSGMTALDLGASTGGFTDCLLQRGAAKVYAVDVGYGVLDWSLRADARVDVRERCNARFITPDMFSPLPDIIVCDISFISIKAVLPAAARCLREDGQAVFLIKPQFEAPAENVEKGGVVRDKTVQIQAACDVISAAESAGFFMAGLDFSPIKGPSGNIEFLLWLKRKGPGIDRGAIVSVVDAAHNALDR